MRGREGEKVRQRLDDAARGKLIREETYDKKNLVKSKMIHQKFTEKKI